MYSFAEPRFERTDYGVKVTWYHLQTFLSSLMHIMQVNASDFELCDQKFGTQPIRQNKQLSEEELRIPEVRAGHIENAVS